MLDHWQEVFQTLRRNKLRTFLTACGVFWGVFMLVVMLGFGKGLENGANRGFRAWAVNAVTVWGNETSLPYAGRAPGRNLQLTIDDAQAVAAQVDGVLEVLPRNFAMARFGGSRVSRKNKSDTFGVNGEVAHYPRVEDLNIERGRFLDEEDDRELRKVAVIGSRVQEVLFEPGEDPLGAQIRVDGVEMLVVGVHRSSLGGRRADWANGRIFVPRATVARMYGRGLRINQMSVLVAPERSALEVEDEVKALLHRRHSVHPDDKEAFGSWNRARDFAKFNTIFNGIAALTWFVGVLTLVAGAIGVSNIMMIAVAERTREIGIRKAVGATPLSLVGQIVSEAMVLTGLAGYLGLVAGVGVVEIAARIMAAAAARGP
ncbi:MAG TPA: ABC transporter permease, partial [Polyangia bacterium]|nr:ABC transporter permease [Polyangia bacterium]